MGYIVYELLVGLAAATASEADPQIAKKPRGAGHDRDQLVHVPNCLFVPNVRLRSRESSRIHSWAIAVRTLFPNVESASSSTRSPTPSLARRLSCNDHVHEIPSLSCSRTFFKSYRHF